MGFIKYLIAQEIDYKWGLVTTTVGLQEGVHGMSYPYGDHPTKYHFTQEKGRILDEFQLVYIIKGEGESKQYVRTEVKTGLSDGVNIEIKSGVTDKDKVRGPQVIATEVSLPS